ncbi:MAG: energy transducer TonB [Hyphomonadaceae bacterium]|nr:energy transducer TonB [Hyphomonadaceae bacterium]
MADVLIVCVREDEPQAKALAEMFEAAGFSIGGAPANDAALRSSGAGVVVWSQASIRSRPFLDAAQRVINAEKAVVASLIEPPPASSIGSSPAFDLSNWSGDPNDPALDPLFFAVDRMVNAARATVGAASPARQDTYPEPAPQALPRTTSRSRPTPPATPVASPTPTPRASNAAGDIKSEAEYWRSIRDSRDPADFMDYIARFGANGTFAELAELKLSQLTGAQPSAPAARSRATPAVPPTRVRTEQPAPARRPEALPPTPRRTVEAPPRRMPPPERAYDRTEYREPKTEGGGALRTFVIVAVLGGAALGGGLYLGGGIDTGRERQVAEDNSAPASSYDAGDEAAAGDEGPSFLEAERAGPIADPAPARQTAAAPRTATAENRPARQDGMGGPISLSPGEPPAPSAQAATTPRSGPVSLVPAAPSTQPQTEMASVSTPPEQTPPAAAAAGRVAWAQRPSARRIADLYPERALRAGMGGRVQLDCTVLANLTVSCSILSETPPGMGFGAAALSAASAYRAQPRLSDGASAVGSQARIAIAFQAPE